MIRDQLDELLDASAPPPATIRSVDTRAMLAEARTVARPRRRGRRAAVLSGALGLLLVGGAGIATASSDWLWGSGLEDPDRSYTYTSPTWGECEIRYSGWDIHNPVTQLQVNRIIDDWFANTDVEAAAEPYVAEQLAAVEADLAASEETATDPRQPDLNAWRAHDQALSMALYEELKANGIDTGRGDLAGTDSHSQLHCEGEDWGGEGGAS
ncbi:hypothetical protein HCX50_06745 [Microbacterium oxydans]|uniref:hypothetical protein n=1 Tax=Microbacterium sp. B19(2022) TaxID=2914045 RepID=UPI00143032D1|nr:hypothetical protein [Microbacterium sp. B19(2022)]NJI59123.1 hypothetical protein [Microbacterium sp. B19(2022)]